jgi:hypothetical protein
LYHSSNYKIHLPTIKMVPSVLMIYW